MLPIDAEINPTRDVDSEADLHGRIAASDSSNSSNANRTIAGMSIVQNEDDSRKTR